MIKKVTKITLSCIFVICNNPAIGPDSYDIDYKYSYFGKVKYWYINWAGTGGG